MPPIWVYAWPWSGAAIGTHWLPWQKVPSSQGVARLAQGALIPLHSFALQDDMSVEIFIGAMNPSLQNPPEHFWPLGQTLLAIQGSLADAPFHLGTYLLLGWKSLTKTNATNETAKTRPIPELSFNISSVQTLYFYSVEGFNDPWGYTGSSLSGSSGFAGLWQNPFIQTVPGVQVAISTPHRMPGSPAENPSLKKATCPSIIAHKPTKIKNKAQVGSPSI